ncbi:MAG TPA: TonB-dependent receptor [Steroidobacteraceae bacterium]|nr:TonB-dependent receptor [Steroidobacteraceae bacterium]
MAALAGGVGSFAAPRVALAQQEVEQPQGVLEEVVVNAQRSNQALQDVPISVQVVDSDLINDTAATNMNDLNGFIPGLVVSGGSPTQPKYQLRGIQTGDFGIGTDPAVGVYLDGIYSARSGASLTTFNDIDHVEVLKGPQGTLLGRNSAAGAVSIYTKQPTDKWEGNVRARMGDYGTQLYSGVLNAPITDGLALRTTGVYNSSDGWIKDAATHKELNPTEEYSFRTALRWDIAEATSATLTWDYDNLDQLARPAIGIVPVSDTYPFVPFFSPPGELPANYSDTYVNPLKAKVYNDVVKNDESRLLNRYNLFIDHDFGWANFRSSTSYTKFNTNNREDEDGTNLRPYLYFDTANIEHNQSWYQEFKFSHSDEKFDWVAGVSYYSEDAKQTSAAHTYTDSVDRALVNLGYAGAPGLFAGTDFLYNNFFVPYVLDNFGTQLPALATTGQTWDESMYNHGEYSAVAVFGDTIWHATDRLNLTFGLRYTSDDKHFSWLNGPRVAPGADAALAEMEAYGFFDWIALAHAADPDNVPLLTPDMYQNDLVFVNNPAIEGQKIKKHDTWSDWSPRLVADYKYTDNVMFWGSIAKGYKAGGYNSVEIGSVFDPEDVWNYEAGVKSVFPEINLLVNSSVYYYIYKDKQAISLVTQTEGVPKYLIDTSDEQAWGVDLDARWQPIPDLTLTGTVAWIDATYASKKTAEGVDLSGDPTGEPYWSLSLGADYVVSLGEYGHTDFSAQWGYRGETRCNAGATLQGTCQVSPNFKVGESQQRLDLRAAWTSDSERWGAAVFVTNVFDDQYVDGVNNLTTSTFGTPFASITAPRQWGVEALYQF